MKPTKALEKQRMRSDLSGQGLVYALALLGLIVYALIASGVLQFSPGPQAGAASESLPSYATPR